MESNDRVVVLPDETPGLRVRTGLKIGRGLGDLAADFTHATGLDRLAHAYTQVTGRDCGCDQRREWLNRIAPLG